MGEGNQAPTAIVLSNTVVSLAENTANPGGLRVADLAITDDALGTNILALTGAESASFEIRTTGSGNSKQLFFIAPSTDYETKAAYNVTLTVDDNSVGSTPDASKVFSFAITDVKESDVLPPKGSIDLTITSNSPNTVTGTAGFTIQFSEDVMNFAASLITITCRDAAGNTRPLPPAVLTPAAGSDQNKRFTLDVNPPANTAGTLVVTVPAGAVTGTSGASNTAATASQPFNTINTGTTTSVSDFSTETINSASLSFSSTSNNQVPANISLNSTGVSFAVAPPQSPSGSHVAARVPLDLALVAPVAKLQEPNSFLSYYTIRNGKAEEFLYDASTRTGARFYNVVNRRIVELSFVDNARGDKDDTLGRILDPSVGAVATVTPTLIVDRNTSVTLGGAGTTPASIPVQATVRSAARNANQIWYVSYEPGTLDPTVYNPCQPAVNQPSASLLLSALENSDTGLASATGLSVLLPLVSGRSLAFYEVSDGADGGRLNSSMQATLLSVQASNGLVTLSSSQGLTIELKTLASSAAEVNTLASYVSRDQDQAPLLNFSGLSSSDRITGQLVISREADYASSLGFYRVANIEGAVLSGGQLIYPGQSGYLTAAMNNRVSDDLASLDNITVADNSSSQRNLSFSSTDLLAPYALVNGSTTYVAYAAANPDGVAHFRSLGTNVFGFEDLYGGGDRDFDDQVLTFRNLNLAT